MTACAVCGSTSNVEYDHRIPAAFGGPTTPANLRPMCRTCHSQKSAIETRVRNLIGYRAGDEFM